MKVVSICPNKPRCRRVGKRWKLIGFRDQVQIVYSLCLSQNCDMKNEMEKKLCTEVMEKITMWMKKRQGGVRDGGGGVKKWIS